MHTHSSGTRGAVEGLVPCSRVSSQSWYQRWRERSLFTPPTDNSCRTRDSNPQPQVTSQTLYPLGHDCPVLLYYMYYMCLLLSLPFCLSNCHQTKFLVGANISGNKALSDSDSKIPQERCQKLVSGCATYFQQVIKAKGSFTKY